MQFAVLRKHVRHQVRHHQVWAERKLTFAGSIICEKRDLREIFMNIEILAWIDSSVYAETDFFFTFQPLLENEYYFMC